MGYSPQGRKESDTTEPLHFTSLHFWYRMIDFKLLVALKSPFLQTSLVSELNTSKVIKLFPPPRSANFVLDVTE